MNAPQAAWNGRLYRLSIFTDLETTNLIYTVNDDAKVSLIEAFSSADCVALTFVDMDNTTHSFPRVDIRHLMFRPIGDSSNMVIKEITEKMQS